MISEFRVEYLNPPFMSEERPTLSKVPTKIAFNEKFVVELTIPRNLQAENIQGFSKLFLD